MTNVFAVSVCRECEPGFCKTGGDEFTLAGAFSDDKCSPRSGGGRVEQKLADRDKYGGPMLRLWSNIAKVSVWDRGHCKIPGGKLNYPVPNFDDKRFTCSDPWRDCHLQEGRWIHQPWWQIIWFVIRLPPLSCQETKNFRERLNSLFLNEKFFWFADKHALFIMTSCLRCDNLVLLGFNSLNRFWVGVLPKVDRLIFSNEPR